MGQYAGLIVAAGKVTRAYGERLLAGVVPSQFARLPAPGGSPIKTNHPAWVYGHLATYPAKTATMLGLDPAPLAAPPEFEALFKDGTECLDDPGAKVYPAMEKTSGAFFRAHDRLMELLPGIDDAKLLELVTDEKIRQRWPMTGARVLFMCNNHPMMHFGQISAWRRCMGLPPA